MSDDQSASCVPRSTTCSAFVQNVLPFLTSVTVHAAILLIGVVFFLGAQYVASQPPHQEQLIPADTSIIQERLGGFQAGELVWDRLTQPRQADDKTAVDEGLSQRWGNKLSLSEPGGGAGDSTDALIGLGPGGGVGMGKHGTGAGSGEGLGTGNGGGPIAAFGQPDAGGIGSRGLFAPPGGAKRVVFVCDASGSMLNKFSVLEDQLSRAIQKLRPNQSFNVIFFQEQSAVSLAPSLLIANPQNKLNAINLLTDVVPRSETNPIPGIQLAFRNKPQIIYLLTDGDFPDNDAVLKTIRELNKAGTVRINTIAFVGDADKDTAFMELLKTIAAENRGIYRFVRESELR